MPMSGVVQMSVSQELYESVSVEDPEGRWELHEGKLREKPVMSYAHKEVMFEIGFQLGAQLDPDLFLVRSNAGRLRLAPDTVYIPDVFVIPRSAVGEMGANVPALDTYAEPARVVVEVWSPSTGEYDIDQKIPQYAVHGDREIWRVHPRERSIEVWVRAEGGSYSHQIQQGGTLSLRWLPGIRVDSDPIFKRIDRGR
jgi:Uma2 family endonuclease